MPRSCAFLLAARLAACLAVSCSDVQTHDADGFTCGQRIKYRVMTGMSKEDAQALVADEYPDECGACSSANTAFAPVSIAAALAQDVSDKLTEGESIQEAAINAVLDVSIDAVAELAKDDTGVQEQIIDSAAVLAKQAALAAVKHG